MSFKKFFEIASFAIQPGLELWWWSGVVSGSGSTATTTSLLTQQSRR